MSDQPAPEPRDERVYHCHHDSLVLSERDIDLLHSFLEWVDTVRSSPRAAMLASATKDARPWTPSHIDMMKSRLFWWVRSGHQPLPYPPPTAYSCPWYEVVVEEGNHHVYDMHFYAEGEHWTGGNKANVSQTLYDIIEKKSDEEYILGFGPYRFRAFRDVEMHARQIATINPHRPFEETYNTYLEKARNEPSQGWWITRVKELEDWDNFDARPKLTFTLEYIHDPEYDPEMTGDYTEVRVYDQHGKLFAQYGGYYHDKGDIRARAFVEGYAKALGLNITLETRHVTNDNEQKKQP